MSDTKRRLYRCAVAALAAYALVGFSFLLFVSAGMDNANSDISAFAARLVASDLFIALFSAIFGFSFMIFGAKKLSSAAKRAFHIILNCIAVNGCAYALCRNVSEVKVSTWLVLFFVVTAVYFAVYGLCMFVSFLRSRR